MSDFLPWITWLNEFNGLDQKIEKSFKRLDNLYDSVIEEHLDLKRPKPEHEDLADVLLRVQNDPSQTIALTNDQIKGVLGVCCVLFLLAFEHMLHNCYCDFIFIRLPQRSCVSLICIVSSFPHKLSFWSFIVWFYRINSAGLGDG